MVTDAYVIPMRGLYYALLERNIFSLAVRVPWVQGLFARRDEHNISTSL